MNDIPRRTSVTDLSDDELLLLDFFFDKRSVAGLARQNKYPVHMNVPYSHGLDDQQLRDTLKSLYQRQLLARYVFEGDFAYEMSPAGGALWELKRQPIWDRYCEILEKPLRPNDWNGSQLMTVLSPSLQTVQDYVEKALATGASKAKDFPPKSRYRLLQRFRLDVYWKEFAEAHAILLRVFPDYLSMDHSKGEEFTVEQWACRSAARNQLEANRTWWGTIGELDTLRRKFDNY
jgi:hypothetical protein